MYILEDITLLKCKCNGFWPTIAIIIAVRNNRKAEKERKEIVEKKQP